MDWKIFYADGSTFNSSQGRPGENPPTGAILILQRDALSIPEMVKGDNYYWYNGAAMQWRGGCRDAVIEALLEGDPIEGFMQGRRLSRVAFYETMRIARADPDFQPA